MRATPRGWAADERASRRAPRPGPVRPCRGPIEQVADERALPSCVQRHRHLHGRDLPADRDDRIHCMGLEAVEELTDLRYALAKRVGCAPHLYLLQGLPRARTHEQTRYIAIPQEHG